MKRTLLALFIMLCSISLSTHAQTLACDSLVSPCVNTFSVNGFFFDLKATAAGDITIKSFATLTQNAGTRDVRIYYCKGSFVGEETNPSAWDTVGSLTGFNPAAKPTTCPVPSTEIPIPVEVCIPSGQTYGFYIMRTGGTGTFEANDSVAAGQVVVANSSLVLYSGKTSQAYTEFSSTSLKNAMSFQGRINYSCGCLGTSTSDKLTTASNRIYPMPAEDQLNIDLTLATGHTTLFTVYDVTGRMVLQQSKHLSEGFNHCTLNVKDLGAGIYTLRVSGRGESLYKGSFIKM